jgi:hypothetical protein
LMPGCHSKLLVNERANRYALSQRPHDLYAQWQNY